MFRVRKQINPGEILKWNRDEEKLADVKLDWPNHWPAGQTHHTEVLPGCFNHMSRSIEV